MAGQQHTFTIPAGIEGRLSPAATDLASSGRPRLVRLTTPAHISAFRSLPNFPSPAPYSAILVAPARWPANYRSTRATPSIGTALRGCDLRAYEFLLRASTNYPGDVVG